MIIIFIITWLIIPMLSPSKQSINILKNHAVYSLRFHVYCKVFKGSFVAGWLAHISVDGPCQVVLNELLGLLVLLKATLQSVKAFRPFFLQCFKWEIERGLFDYFICVYVALSQIFLSILTFKDNQSLGCIQQIMLMKLLLGLSHHHLGLVFLHHQLISYMNVVADDSLQNQ